MNATPRPGTSADVTGSTAAADLEDVRRRKNRPGVANPFSAELKHRDADCEVSMPTSLPTHIECIDPILRVEDMGVSVRYYVDVLGFEEAPWGTDDFTHVMLGGRGIYLCKGGQGHVGAWVWVGVGDARALYRVYKERGAIIQQNPIRRPWALEMQVRDPDGNVLRFGSDPEKHS